MLLLLMVARTPTGSYGRPPKITANRASAPVLTSSRASVPAIKQGS